MINLEQVREITKQVLKEEHLTGFIKIFEKEHNLFRGSHDKIGLPETIVIPQPIINQIVEKFDTQLTEGSIPIIDETGHFTEDNEKLFYDKEKKILCLGLNNPVTDMVGGYCMKEGTPPTINIENAIQAYALDTPLERLTDGGLEDWLSATNLTHWTESGGGVYYGIFREAAIVHGGTYSARLLTTYGGDLCWFLQDFTLTPGNACLLSCWYIKGAHASSDLRIYVSDTGFNVSLKSDGTWQAGMENPIEMTDSAVWKLFELEFQAHPDYTDYRIRFYKGHGAGGAISYYVDDVSLAEIGNVIPFFRTSTGIVIGFNQDLRTTAHMTLAGLTLSDFSGVLKAVDGVLTKGADHVDLANITSDQHHPQAHSHAHGELTEVVSGQHHPQLHAAEHLLAGGDAIKLDDLASPDDNVDLNASTVKHGLLMKLGGGEINFLRADGTWAVPAGGNGATTFLGLIDTPANYTEAGNKIVKVNATPNALVFGADISDLEDVDSITGQAGKYARVKAADAGVEWVAGTGNSTFPDLTDTPEDYVDQAGKFCKVKATEDGLEFAVAGDGAQGPVLIFDSGFNDLALGDINGKGDYSYWGTWVNGSGAGCTAEIVTDPSGGKMLRLNDQSAVNACIASLTMTPAISAEVLVGIVEWKVRVSALAASSRGYFNIQDKDIAATEQGAYFRGDSNDIWYRSSGNITAKLVDAVVDTWYIVRNFFDRLGNYTVWWVDGAFEQNRTAMNAGDKFDKLNFNTRDIYSGNVFDIKYVKVWSLHYVA